MRAHIITLLHSDTSCQGVEDCIKSSRQVDNDFEIEKFAAIDEWAVNPCMSNNNIEWTYPWEGTKHDLYYGLELKAYPTANPARRMACFMSHYLLWKECSMGDEPFLILEHDALFTRKLVTEDFMYRRKNWMDKPYIIGINNPLKATRKSREFYTAVYMEARCDIMVPPTIDRWRVPQGLAGNSAYIITPSAAKDVLEKVKTLGAWPNDALLCQQIFPYLRVTTDFYTRVQGLESTTTL